VSALVAVVAGAARELAEALVRKHAGAAAASEKTVRAMLAEEIKPIIEKLSTLEADVARRLAELGMLLATSSLADGAAGGVKALEPKGTLPNFLDGADVQQMPDDWHPPAESPLDSDDIPTKPGRDP
jgi:hypothetical protein